MTSQVGNGSPGEIRTLVNGSKGHYAWPLHHRAFTLSLIVALFIVRGLNGTFFPNKRSHSHFTTYAL
jgi:hypothetical protein